MYKTLTGKVDQKAMVIVRESSEEDLKKEIPDLFNNPNLRVWIVSDNVFITSTGDDNSIDHQDSAT